MNFIKSNFKLKILLPVMAIYLIAGIAIYKVVIVSIKKTLSSEFTSKGETIINTLASSIQETLLNRDASTVQGFIDQYRKVEGISFIIILDEKNKIVAHTFYPKVPDYYFKMAKETIDGKKDKEGKIIIEEQILNDRRELVLSRPILGGLLGHIYMGMGIETREKEIISPIVKKIILVISICTIIASFFLVLFLNIILQPVLRLTKAAEAFAQGKINYTSVPVSSQDEIGKLTSAFNKMVEKLTDHTKGLEEEVKKRTDIINDQQMNLAYASKMSALGEMAGGVAHEINNPLTIISSTSTFLKKLIEKGKYDPIVFNKCLEQIEQTIIRMAKIVQGLKTVSRDSTGEEYISVKLRDLMDDVVSLCSDKFKNHGVGFIIDLSDPAYDHVIECRRVQISQIFINLLGNAYDAIENLPERWIKIECQCLADTIEFRIIDSGQGIPKEIQEKVFQPFFTTKPIGKGTGLGLSLSISIVKDHNGTFTIDDRNPNTCFVISLPNVRKAA